MGVEEEEEMHLAIIGFKQGTDVKSQRIDGNLSINAESDRAFLYYHLLKLP